MMAYLKYISTLLILLSFQSLSAEVQLPEMISDGMILQRESNLKIWGWADPDEKVTIRFIGKKYHALTNSAGNWEILIPPLKAGGPYTMKIIADNKIEINNILIGDVWVCSGQSNMTHFFGRHQERYAKEIAEADFPEIRQLFIPDNAILEGPADDIDGLKWISSSPETILDFTVIGYFFAKKLYDKYDVPMGIINTCVGGTKIEAWTSENGFKEFPEILKTIEQNKDTSYLNQINREVKA
nr:sialate O-acetylesterase [Bacteroidales bacterium]